MSEKTSGRPGRRLVPATKVWKQRYGVCARTGSRWQKDPRLEFPSPLIINNRQYFYEDQLELWERKRAARKA